MRGNMKEEFIERINKLFRTDDRPNFRLQLKIAELKTLQTRIRDRRDLAGGQG
jgi:hypothetical protein